MKITKSLEDVNKEKFKKQQANIGCKICPGCGNENVVDLIDYFNLTHEEKQECIIVNTYYVSDDRLFRSKSGCIDKYKCNKCECEWESEAY